MAGPDDLAPGAVVGGEYRIERALKQGGMGAVYVAEQLSTGARRALKVVLPELVADEGARKRFEREARVGARIESEHVVEVLAAGVDGTTGMPYLVMELLEGEDLEAYLERRGALSAAETLALLAQVCHAVGAAHRAGIVHRDLKLENVFRAIPRGKGDEFRVKVLDFGSAKLLTEVQTTASRTRKPLGTPLYMAPEQANPKLVGAVGPQADVWALGLMAFRLLTGRHFWMTAYHPEASIGMLVAEACYEALPLASERAAALGAAHLLPPGFDAWMARALARDPSARFADASETIAALEPVLRGHAAFDATLPASEAPAPATRTAQLATAPTAPATTLPLRGTARRLPAAMIAAGASVAGVLALAVGLAWPDGAPGTNAPAGPDALEASTAAAPSPDAGPPSDAVSPSATASHAAAAAAASPPAPCADGMVFVPAATAVVGSADGQGEKDEHPSHEVRLSAYCIDRTEVTVAAYRACSEQTRDGVRCAPAPTTASWRGIPRAVLAEYERYCNGGRADLDAHPVNCVDWTQADVYCRWRGGRLPTEAEWEHAARGDTARAFPWGDAAPSPELLNGCGTECRDAMARPGIEPLKTLYASADPYAATAPVGSYPEGASPFGLLDMAGNVREWTADWYAPYGVAQLADPVQAQKPATSPRHVVRGGAWDASAAFEVR
ncbi:MAG: SUMF1/EgtB/PvdO family nonheme iron enzyme, partial [Polyangiaceae bacterium]|nr:SUMF1/EgtB/PvdO family nonheme iron enzyme [Polyangiaceae bacterium]